MATLGDLMNVSAGNDRAEYLSYVESCMTAGNQPMAYAAWVAAGKPAK